MNKTEILEVLNKYEANSGHSHQSLVWDHADKCTVYSDNKSYIDFTSGIFVTNSGHSTISKYITEQAKKGLIYSYAYPTEIKAKFIKKFMETVPSYLEKVSLANTGAEAVEVACKLMRLAQVKRNQWGGKVIVSIRDCMHGKSFLGEKLKGINEWALAHDPDFFRIWSFPSKESNFLEDIANLTGKMAPDNIAGIILESYRGWNAKFMPKKYVKDIFKFAKKFNIMVCFDEVQGGFWRTGKLFAYQHYEVEPDLVCVGKGLGGGVPISAVLGKAKILDLADDLTSTFSGNPISCAGALGNLIELEKLDHNVLKETSSILVQRLEEFKRKYSIVKEVHSKGLLASIIFPKTHIATEIYHKALKKGLLVVVTGRHSIKIGPPLIITKDEITKGLNILEEIIKELNNKF